MQGVIDWDRRHDHMQQHTGQHLLSAVLEELFSIPTLSFHMGEETSTIEIGAASLTPAQITAVERRVHAVIWEGRPVQVTYEKASEASGLRKASQREGTLRIVSIEGLDRSACGGTHVRSTSAIGAVQIRKLDRIRGNVRLEFLCGARALDRARADFEALSAIARAFSCPIGQAPELVAALQSRAADLDRSRRKLALELAAFQGRQLYENTAPSPDGMRRAVSRFPSGAISEETRALAQSFVSGAGALFAAVSEDPPSILFAASPDSGIHAGEVLKRAVSAAGAAAAATPNSPRAASPAARPSNSCFRACWAEKLIGDGFFRFSYRRREDRPFNGPRSHGGSDGYRVPPPHPQPGRLRADHDRVHQFPRRGFHPPRP